MRSTFITIILLSLVLAVANTQSTTQLIAKFDNQNLQNSTSIVTQADTNKVRNQISTIKQIATNPSSADPYLLAHYLFNGDATDQTDNHYDGTVQGPILAEACCDNPSAYQFDGSNDYISTSTVFMNQIGANDFTLEVWIKGKEAGQAAHPCMLSNRPRGRGGFMLFLHRKRWGKGPYKLLTLQMNGRNLLGYGTPNLLDGNCHHVAVVRENTTLRYYADGEMFHTRTIPASYTLSSSGTLLIGYDRRSSRSHPFEGLIEELKIWKVAKSDSEIQQAAGAGPTCEALVLPTAMLKKKLDGGTHLVAGKELQFQYEEDYNVETVSCKVYNWLRDVVIDEEVPVSYGSNTLKLDVSGIVNGSDHFVLEVENRKGEKWVLGFR